MLRADLPDHRLRTALALRDLEPAPVRDRWVRRAVRVLRLADRGNGHAETWTRADSTVARALLLALIPNLVAFELRLRVLARQSARDIAQAMSIGQATVRAFESLAFDVRPLLDHPNRLSIALEPRSDRPEARREAVALRGAYRLGVAGLPTIFDWWLEPDRIETDERSAWIRASLLLDWATEIGHPRAVRLLPIVLARLERLRSRDPNRTFFPTTGSCRTVKLPWGTIEQRLADREVSRPEVCLRQLADAMSQASNDPYWALSS